MAVAWCREQFNQATLAAAYEKRTEKIKPDRSEYEEAKVGGRSESIGGWDDVAQGCAHRRPSPCSTLSHTSAAC